MFLHNLNYSPDGHDMRQYRDGVPLWQLGDGEDGERDEEVQQVEGGQADQELVEVGTHLGAGENKDRENIAWGERKKLILNWIAYEN